jgi:hypothetical protein
MSIDSHIKKIKEIHAKRCNICLHLNCECDPESEYDCPCSERGCCANPVTFTPKHKCSEEVCESCFILACSNCNSRCSCDL